MTAADTLSFIGNDIEVTYYNGTGYVTTTAHYDRVVSANVLEASENPVGFVAGSSVPWLQYSFSPSGVDRSPSYITFSLTPRYSIFDTEYLYTCLALSSAMSAPSNSTYNSPASNWYVGGSVLNFHNTSQSDTNSGYKSFLNFGTAVSSTTRIFTYVPIVHSQQNTFSAYCQDVAFYGNDKDSSGSYYFMVMCPYVSTGSSGASGTFTGAVTTASSSGGFDTDLTETNGLISGVISAIGNAVSSVIDSIAGLFVPDDEFLEDWVDGMKTLLSDHLGGLYQAIDLLTDFYDVYQGVTAKQSIHVDTVSVPLAGTSFTLGGWDMPLKVTGLPAVLYDGIAYIVDFLAVMMFLKMCRNKLEIILNPDSEVVQNDN